MGSELQRCTRRGLDHSYHLTAEYPMAPCSAKTGNSGMNTECTPASSLNPTSPLKA